MTRHNHSTTIKGPNLCNCKLRLQTTDTRHTQPIWDKHQIFLWLAQKLTSNILIKTTSTPLKPKTKEQKIN